MSEVFVDTGAWFALQVPDDAHHQAAVAVFPSLLETARALVTTDLVVSECYTLLRIRAGFEAAWRFLEGLDRSVRTRVVETGGLFADTRKVLKRYREHAFSYTDAASFALMARRDMKYAFAFDGHFATAGYLRIPVDLPQLPDSQ